MALRRAQMLSLWATKLAILVFISSDIASSTTRLVSADNDVVLVISLLSSAAACAEPVLVIAVVMAGSKEIEVVRLPPEPLSEPPTSDLGEG